MAAISERLNEALATPEVRARWDALGISQHAITSPMEYAAFYRDEFERWGRVIKDAGIRLE